MKTRSRFLKSVIKTATETRVELPWERSAKIARREQGRRTTTVLKRA